MTDTRGASAPSILRESMEKFADNIELVILFTIFAVSLQSKITPWVKI